MCICFINVALAVESLLLVSAWLSTRVSVFELREKKERKKAVGKRMEIAVVVVAS